jgi:Bacterial membrane protein YfhO
MQGGAVVVSPRRELFAFSVALAAIVGAFFADSLVGGQVLSPSDVLFASKSFREVRGATYEPANRLLIDPVLQFQPWLEFNRSMIRSGRLPLWNPMSGCGAPHLANGQSAVFDPFQVIAYLGELPQALGWMAATRLWFAGLGMFLLARAWGFGPWGRWFSGLAFPFCGFLVVWLLFPVTNVAIWLPWVLLATERVWDRPSALSVGWLAMAVGGTLLGGHVQTSAHVLLAAGAYSCWRAWHRGSLGRSLVAWSLGVTLGVGIAAVEVVPLGSYLTRSPVWGDRERERTPPWMLARPRVLDAGCTALPYLYGSQRRGQPNLAKALGVYNLNESAGGFAGLATLIWLAPLAWSARRSQPRVKFLVGLTVFGFLGAFRLPPVDNLLRALPVLGVTDNRRLTLWLAFGLVSLGGIGLDRLWAVRESVAWERWGWGWVAAAIALLAAAGGVEQLAPSIRAKALAHYASASEATPGAEPEVFQDRAERQVRETLEFVPRYLGLAAAQGLILAALLAAVARRRIGDNAARSVLLGLTMIDLLAFGHGLNPAIPRGDDRPEPPVIAALRREVGRSGRIIGLGAELPPNSLMRYGLADARNYDSVELSRSLDWLGPLYDPKVQEKTSRREISWARVLQARDRLREAAVRAIVSPTPPPASGFDRVEKVGSVWVAWLEARPIVEVLGNGSLTNISHDPGRIEATIEGREETRLIVRETFDPGWRAEVDGDPAPVEAHLGTFQAVAVPSGKHQVVLVYEPIEVRFALMISLAAVFGAVFALTDFGSFRFTRIVDTRLGRIQAVGLESSE